MHILFLQEDFLRLRIYIIQSEKYVSRLEVSVGNTIFVKKCKSLQGLLEDAFGHLKRVADYHVYCARAELWQLLDHTVHTWAHGLEYQALVDAIGALVFKFV